MKLSEIAKETHELEEEIGLNIDDVLNKFTQEVGEFNDAVQKIRGRYCRSNITQEELRKEIGDVLLNFISICYRIGEDPDELAKYAEKTLESFRSRKQDYIDNLKREGRE